jgi:hypothetical protein
MGFSTWTRLKLMVPLELGTAGLGAVAAVVAILVESVNFDDAISNQHQTKTVTTSNAGRLVR